MAVKQAGGKWQPEQKAWLLSYKVAVELGLQERIINRGWSDMDTRWPDLDTYCQQWQQCADMDMSSNYS